MKTKANIYLEIGDTVCVSSYEGFGGYGVVIAIREMQGSHYQVRLDSQDIWLFDGEITSLPNDETLQYFYYDFLDEK